MRLRAIKVTKEKIKREGLSKSRFVSPGDFLLTNSMSFGRPYIMATVGCIHDGWLVLKPRDRKLVDHDYFYHQLGSNAIYEMLSSRASGSTVKNLNTEIVSSVEIKLPPIDEQRRIAAILDKADALRLKRKEALDLLDSLAQSIFLEMFGRPGDPASPVRQRPLSEISELINGDRSSNYPSGDDIKGAGILFLNTTNITPEGLDLSTANYITEKKFASLSRGKLIEGDIVITLRGSLGQTAIFENAGDSGFINAQMMIIRPKKDVDARYLLQALQLDDMLAHLKKIGSGSAVPQLTAKQMAGLEIPVPGLGTQRAFGRRREALHKVRMAAMLEMNNLDTLFFSLQSHAFLGQL